MTPVRVEREIAGRKLSIETGKVAKQADAATWVQYGETVVLATVVWSDAPRRAGLLPPDRGLPREAVRRGQDPRRLLQAGRPADHQGNPHHADDRPALPAAVPAGFINEVQIQVFVMSADQDERSGHRGDDRRVGGAADLELPWDGPIGAVRVGRVEGKFILNPTHAQMEYSDLDLILAGHHEAINMIELGANQIKEEDLAEGDRAGPRGDQGGLRADRGAGRQVREGEDLDAAGPRRGPLQEGLREGLRAAAGGQADHPASRNATGRSRPSTSRRCCRTCAGSRRTATLPAAPAEDLADPKVVRPVPAEIEEKVVTDLLLVHGKRVDGRSPTDIRRRSGARWACCRGRTARPCSAAARRRPWR